MGTAKAASVENVHASQPSQADLLCGWERHWKERRDFYHRVRTFPPSVAEWRKEWVKRIKAKPKDYPNVPEGAGDAEVRALLDQGITFLLEIARLLSLMYSGERDKSELPRLSADSARVLKRLKPYAELGLDLGKKRPASLQKLLPPAVTETVAKNLATHSKEICTRNNPECNRCELRNFCGQYRAEEAKRADASEAPSVIDLFAGAGGSSEGFRRAGFRVALSLDKDSSARKTYWLNHPEVPDERIICGDITEFDADRVKQLVPGGKVDVVIGSPPCQGFSSVGFRGKKTKTSRERYYHPAGEERNSLFEHMIQLVLDLEPSLVLLENVPGMNTLKRSSSGGRGAKWDRSFLECAAQQLEEEGGYRTRILRLNAAAFGVPQDRVRTFLVASRLSSLPARPPEDYQDLLRQDYDIDSLPPVGLGEAIFDLPERSANDGDSIDLWDPTATKKDKRIKRYLKKFKLLRDSRILYNHNVRYHNPSDLELYALLQPGEDSVHAVEKYGRSDLMRYRKDAHDDKYYRLRPDRPSKTIVAHLAKDGNGYIHPAQVRSITPREAARAQSFHDRYAFCGSPSEQWRQIGNAVPPVMAEAIAKTFMRAIEREKRNG